VKSRLVHILLGAALAVAQPAWAGPKKRGAQAADAGFAPARGTRVMAPWGRYGKRYPGTVVNQYGKFVEVKYDDGYSGWCMGDLTSPVIAPLPEPKEVNPFTAGQRVMAKWSLKGFLRAVVIDTYGVLTLVEFESDDRAWVRTPEVKAR
jgi:hypothetical protein